MLGWFVQVGIVDVVATSVIVVVGIEVDVDVDVSMLQQHCQRLAISLTLSFSDPFFLQFHARQTQSNLPPFCFRSLQ